MHPGWRRCSSLSLDFQIPGPSHSGSCRSHDYHAHKPSSGDHLGAGAGALGARPPPGGGTGSRRTRRAPPLTRALGAEVREHESGGARAVEGRERPLLRRRHRRQRRAPSCLVNAVNSWRGARLARRDEGSKLGTCDPAELKFSAARSGMPRREVMPPISDALHYPGFPFCLPRMAPLYTRRPPNAPDFVRRTIVRLQRWSPQPAPTWSTSFQGVISDTAPHLYPSSPTLHFRPRVSLPALAAPRSSAACRRTAAGSDVLLPGGASSTGRASRAGPRSSPAAAGDS